MHAVMEIDKRNGLLAGPDCAPVFREQRTFEVFPPQYHAWAKNARRLVPPTQYSPHCPGDGASASAQAQQLAIRYPINGAVLLFDHAAPEISQAIMVRVEAPSHVRRVTLVVDGRTEAQLEPPFEHPLRVGKGRHTIRAQAGSLASEPVVFDVQ